MLIGFGKWSCESMNDSRSSSGASHSTGKSSGKGTASSCIPCCAIRSAPDAGVRDADAGGRERRQPIVAVRAVALVQGLAAEVLDELETDVSQLVAELRGLEAGHPRLA